MTHPEGESVRTASSAMESFTNRRMEAAPRRATAKSELSVPWACDPT